MGERHPLCAKRIFKEEEIARLFDDLIRMFTCHGYDLAQGASLNKKSMSDPKYRAYLAKRGKVVDNALLSTKEIYWGDKRKYKLERINGLFMVSLKED